MQEDQLYHYWADAGSRKPAIRHRCDSVICQTAVLSHRKWRLGQRRHECNDVGILPSHLHNNRRNFGQQIRKTSSYAHRNDHHFLVAFHRSYGSLLRRGSWKHHCLCGVHACIGIQCLAGPNHHVVRSGSALRFKTSYHLILGLEPHHHTLIRFSDIISGNIDHVRHFRSLHLTLLALLQQISRLDQRNTQKTSLVGHRRHQVRMGKVSFSLLYLNRKQGRR